MQQLPQFPGPVHEHPFKTFWRAHKKTLLVALVFVILVSAAIVGGRLYKHSRASAPSQTASTERSLTLYYRDGKTVLWQSEKGADWTKALVTGFGGHVIDKLADAYGTSALQKGAWRVITTIDPNLQKEAEKQLAAAKAQFEKQHVDSGAIIAQNTTNGQIVSWVDQSQPTIDAAQRLMRKTEVGTLALPFTFAAVIEKDATFTANTTVQDTRQPLPGYPCTDFSFPTLPTGSGNCLHNFDYKFEGQVTLRRALAAHRRVAALTASLPLLGHSGVSDHLQAFTENLTDDGSFACYDEEPLNVNSAPSPCFTAAVMGGGLYAKPKDVVQGYATLANNGKKTGQTGILKIVRNSETVFTWKAQAIQAISARSAGIIKDILSDPSATYLPPAYRTMFSANNTPVAVSFGTNEDYTIGSTVQFSSKYVVAVWAYDSKDTSGGITGSSELLVSPVASGWMLAAHPKDR
jgi:membrane peptidoglycan carboxypeptidase